MIEDAELLGRYATEQSEEAFAEIVRRHLGLVYGSALRRLNGNAALAEEVAQVVFASLARNAETLARKQGSATTLSGWLYVATRNAAANVFRAEARRRRREQEVFLMHEIEAGGASGEGEAEVWAQVRPELEAVMDELNELDRDAVLLRFFEGRAFGEVGAVLAVSEDAARVRVNRALEKLRELLAKRGIKSTAAALGGLLAGNAAVAAPAGVAASVTVAALAGVATSAVAVGVGSVGAGVSAAGAAGVLSFMTTTKLVTGVACVLAAVSLGTAVFTRTELNRARTESSGYARDGEGARQQAAELAARLSDAEKRTLAAEQERESARKALEDALAKAKGAGAGAKQAMSPARMGLEISNILHEDPGFQEASLQKFLTSVSFTYAPFYRKMGLSAAQVEQFEKALLVREQAQIDRNAAARSQKLSIFDPSLGKVANPGFEEAYAELRRVLGEDGLKRFSDYERAVGSQGETRSVLAASLYSEAPLTLDQTEALAEIMEGNRSSETIGSVITYTGYKWDEIGARVGEALPEAQARFVRQYVERAKAEQLWGDYWRAAQTGKPLSEVSGAKTK